MHNYKLRLWVDGYDRYLTESGAEPVHRDETGILWRIALDGEGRCGPDVRTPG